MRAVLLAGGLGTRLRPLTDSVPKCLVPVGDSVLLGVWLRLFEKHGVGEVLVNLHHLPERVRGFLESYRGSGGAVRVTTTYEPILLGSLGTLLANRAFWAGERAVVVCYADNLTNVDLGAMARFHCGHPLPATVGVFETADARACGVVELDAAGTVVAFEEKPERPRSNVANAGLYVFDTALLDDLDYAAREPLDIGRHLMPALAGRMKAFPVNAHLVDVGTWENYRTAQELFVRRRGDFA